MSFQMNFRVLLSPVYVGTIVLPLSVCLSALTSTGYNLSIRVGVWVSFLFLCRAAYKEEDRFMMGDPVSSLGLLRECGGLIPGKSPG